MTSFWKLDDQRFDLCEKQENLEFDPPPLSPKDLLDKHMCPLKSVASVSVSPSAVKVLLLPTIGFFRFFATSQPSMGVEKWLCPIFEKKNQPKNGPIRAKWGQNEILGHFRVQNALVFADFVYYHSELWYLVGNSGQSAEKTMIGPKMGPIRTRRGQNEVFGHFHVQNALAFANFAKYDKVL